MSVEVHSEMYFEDSIEKEKNNGEEEREL